jgi:hypothetical protein
MEALGIAEYDPSRTYEVVANGGNIDLVERTVSPQGQPVRKVTRLQRGSSHQWQVTAHLLQDPSGKEICSAYVSQAQQDATTGALIPRQVQLVWPAEHIKMKMRIDRVGVNPSTLTADQSARLFTRPSLRDVPSYDLARGFDAASGPLRPAGYR